MAMSFDEKFLNCIQKFNDIEKPDYTESELNYYADFVELIALFSNADGVSRGEVSDRFFGVKEYDNSNKRDGDEAFTNSILLLISERCCSYEEDYPFVFLNDNLLALKTTLSFNNKLYLSLLLSSKLNIFNDFRPALTTDFEEISYNVLKNFLPLNSIIKEFGKNTKYTGNARQKIQQLATDLNLSVDTYELKQVGKRNYQERGLDLIGWIPFKDKCGNKIIFLCQCACGKQYESKQHDTRRFENYIRFYKTTPQHTMFIPYSLINISEDKFYHSDYIEKDYLLFERKRIIDFYDNDVNFEKSKSFKVVDKCIKYFVGFQA